MFEQAQKDNAANPETKRYIAQIEAQNTVLAEQNKHKQNELDELEQTIAAL